MSHPTNPTIDASLMLLRSNVEKCNHFIDLYGSYCDISFEFAVERIALAGTTIDITDFFEDADLARYDQILNADGAGREEAESRRADVREMCRGEWLGVGA